MTPEEDDLFKRAVRKAYSLGMVVALAAVNNRPSVYDTEIELPDNLDDAQIALLTLVCEAERLELD